MLLEAIVRLPEGAEAPSIFWTLQGQRIIVRDSDANPRYQFQDFNVYYVKNGEMICEEATQKLLFELVSLNISFVNGGLWRGEWLYFEKARK